MDESRSRKRFKDLDAFPKVEEGYQERSSSGGAGALARRGVGVARVLTRAFRVQ